MAWQIEVTDTFGGESNYSWVRRYTMPYKEGERQRDTMRRAKALAGYTGVRGRSSNYGDMLEFRPYRICHVLFITWCDDARS